MSIPAGKLRHRITIQQDTSTVVDSFGAPVPVWTKFKEVWAEKREIAGQERLFGVQLQADEISMFRIRHTEGITPVMRIQLNGSTRAQNIERSLDPTGLTEELLILCGEFV